MNREKAIKELEALKFMSFRHTRYEKICKAIDMAIEALKKTADQDCLQCRERGKCAIHDNFNIDYCSDWKLP